MKTVTCTNVAAVFTLTAGLAAHFVWTSSGPLAACLFDAIIEQTLTAALNFWINHDTLAYISWLCEDPRVCSLFSDFWRFEGWCVIVLSLRFMLLIYLVTCFVCRCFVSWLSWSPLCVFLSHLCVSLSLPLALPLAVFSQSHLSVVHLSR